MTRLGVFLAFFIAAFFVPAWPLLLLLAVLYLIAWMLPGGGNPPDDNKGGDSPEPDSPIGGERGWKTFRTSFQSSSKPFFRGTKR
jgi:hypothetical protein